MIWFEEAKLKVIFFDSYRYGGTAAAAGGIVNKALPDVSSTVEVAFGKGVIF